MRRLIFAAWKGEPASLCHNNGEISSKYPDEALVRKMVQIAGVLNAQVQGDDGEVYREDGSCAPRRATVAPARRSLWSRLVSRFRSRAEPPALATDVPQLRVGQHVVDAHGQKATVLRVDAEENAGLGAVVIKYDDDGREATLALVASGLTVID